MSQKDSFDWVYILLMFSVLGWWSVVQIRYLLKRSRSNRWPTVDATIQRGAIGNISFGRGGSAPASFMGYAYIVQGARYAGYFAVTVKKFGSENCMRALLEGPSKFGTSLLTLIIPALRIPRTPYSED